MQPNRRLYLIGVLILIINLVLLMRIGELNNRIENLSQNYNNLQSSLNSISGNVNNTLAQFTREQSLYEHYPSSNNLDSVRVKFYDGSNVIAEKPVEVKQADSNTKIYSLLYDAGSQNISHLVLQIKYTNENVFEKEIQYPL